MRRLIIAVASFAVLFIAGNASAQCRDCDWNLTTGCLECFDTNADAAVLCTITHNGYGCQLDGSCVGWDTWCRYYPMDCPENPLQEDTPVLQGEWQLVAVNIERVKPGRQRS